jgi:O-antigen/teichoic acid export membrane protein
MIKRIFNKNRSLAIYTGGSLFKTAVQIIANAIIFMYIKPSQMGVYNTFVLFQTYALFAQAGIINGLNRELPFTLGEGDDEKATLMASTAFVFTLFSILMVFITGTMLCISVGNSHINRISIVTIVILTAFSFYESYLSSTFRSNQSFEKLGHVFFLRGIMGIITIPLVIMFNYEGYLSRFVLTIGIMLIFMHIVRPIKQKLVFKKELFISLLKTGLPIFGLAYFYQIAVTSDRFWLASMFGTEQVGYYSFGIMTYSAFSTLPITIANYIYPKFSYALGNKKIPLKQLWSYSWKTNSIMLSIMLFLSILGFFITPLIVNTFFPKYVMGINSTRILLFAAAFSGATIGGTLLLSMKSWGMWTFLQIGGGSIIALSIYLCLKLIDNHLVGAAIGVLIGQVFYFLLSNTLTYLRTHEKL